jgi:hypothetical protein
VTLPSLIEQPDEVLSNVMTTLSPEVAVAVGVNDPRTLPAAGTEPAVMVFAPVPTADALPALSNTNPATSADAAPTAAVRPRTDRARLVDLARVERRVISMPTFESPWLNASSEGGWVLTS